jgi:two-component system, NarL family, capsular synthesis sensor histidine kinase RcsC
MQQNPPTALPVSYPTEVDASDAYTALLVVIGAAVATLGLLIAYLRGDMHSWWLLVSLGGILALIAAWVLQARSSQRQRKQLVELHRATHSAQRAATTGTKLLAMISHELRSPLQSFTSIADQLQSATPTTPANLAAFARLNRAIDAMAGRLQNITEYTRGVSTGFVIRADVFNVREVIAKLLSDHADLAKLNESQLSYAVANDVPDLIQADQVRFNQILSNYIVNAVKHAGTATTIAVNATLTNHNSAGGRTSDAILQVEVVDNGQGMDVGLAGLIWSPFEAETATDQQSLPNGLGLTVVRMLADAAQWRVGMHPINPHGCSFYVRLPFKSQTSLTIGQ